MPVVFLWVRSKLELNLDLQQIERIPLEHYLSVNDRCLHFGLGTALTANAEIRWPNGIIKTISNIAATQLVVIKEESGVHTSQRFPLAPHVGRLS